MDRQITARVARALAGALIIAGLLALAACQGSNSEFSNPRPRSREEAGTQQGLPGEKAVSSRSSIDQSGGEVEYDLARLTVPRGAVPEAIFIEIGLPATPPKDVLPDTAYQLNPNDLELQREALLRIAYYDDAVPAGKNEEDLVIVHSVAGVWVELSNTKISIYENTAEVPVRYLGLYALRIRTEDPRRVNTMPLADFEYSFTPYPEAQGKPFDQAKAETGGSAAATDGSAAPPADAAAPGTETPPATDTPPAAEAPPADAAPPGQPSARGGDGPPLALVHEYRVIAGPDDPAAQPTRDEQQAGAANVAEGAPAPTLAEDEAPGNPAIELPYVTVYFDASASSDPDGEVVQYDWDFDSDGVFDYTSHDRPYAEHTYATNGDYTVTLKVSDNGRYSQSGFGTKVVQIRSNQTTPQPFAGQITAYPPAGPCPFTVHLAATVTGGDAPYEFHWTFADGSESDEANPYTTYKDAGQFVIRFEATDHAGAAITGSVLVDSQGADAPRTPQPRMDLELTPRTDRGQAPLTVRLALAPDRATMPVTYNVSFGDEAPGENGIITDFPSLEHTYGNAGFYLVKVIATDADLRTATAFATIYAMAAESPRDFTASEPRAGGDLFSFGHTLRIGFDYAETANRTLRLFPLDAPCELGALALHWDFGDGTYSTETKPSHTYAADGVYEVHLTASDGMQRWRHRIWLPVSGKFPAAAIQRPAYLEGPAPLRLTWDAIVTRGAEPFRYDWTFGEARRSDPSTYFSFDKPGQYEVRLQVFDKHNEPINAPPVKVVVREPAASYRQPLAVVQPLSGSTRCVVLDYSGANPLPLSSPSIEGAVTKVGLSRDGRNVVMAGSDWLVVKRIADAAPLLAFLPANGEIAAVAALDTTGQETAAGSAYCTVETPTAAITYLLRPGAEPLEAGRGYLRAVSGDGSALVLATLAPVGADPADGVKPCDFSLISLDVAGGQVGAQVGLGRFIEAGLSRDGRTLYFLDGEQRLGRRTLPSGKEVFLATGKDRKYGLAVADNGLAVAFVSEQAKTRELIYGRNDSQGEFRLASLTDQTGWFSDHLALSADGRFLLGYGSRDELSKLVSAARGETLAADETTAGIDGEAAEPDKSAVEEFMQIPHRRHDRFGVIRVDLSAAPADWTISKVNPRFVSECSAIFSTAGPFS